ncbi:MAG: hypothetical protein ACFFCO_05245 [Promethearchaeota archaeon]
MTGKRVVRRGLRASVLMRVRRNTGDTRFISLSKRKVMVRHGNLSLVLRKTDPLAEEIEQIIDAYHEKQLVEWEATRTVKEEAVRRARRLLQEIMQEHDCLYLVDDEVIVESRNGRRYAISLKTGSTYRIGSKKRRFVCVQVYDSAPNGFVPPLLPLADRIIAKALTIAYAPRLINTL